MGAISRVTGHYVDVNAGDCEYKMFYLESGSGPPLVCQHTAGCHNCCGAVARRPVHVPGGHPDRSEDRAEQRAHVHPHIVSRHRLNGHSRPLAGRAVYRTQLVSNWLIVLQIATTLGPHIDIINHSPPMVRAS